jgi:tRNA (guanosine-2'-O-)-methyltransferase
MSRRRPPARRGAGPASSSPQKGPRELRAERLPRAHGCWDHLVVAPLFVTYEANFGTLLRTCDAVGACCAVPHTATARASLKKGNTLRVKPCVHWCGNRRRWIERERERGARIVGVELVDQAIRLADVVPAREKTVVLLGHEHDGIPDEIWPLLDDVIEIPMVGNGSSLNVAVAGSLVLYKLAGLS